MNLECCICWEAFEGDNKKVSVIAKCGHYFHCDCIDDWLANHPTCPMCRCRTNHNQITTLTLAELKKLDSKDLKSRQDNASQTDNQSQREDVQIYTLPGFVDN